MKRRRSISRRRGGVAVFTAVSLPALLCATALVLDGGMLMSRQRQTQAVADAAAHAAACMLYKNYAADSGLDPSGTAQAAAISIAKSNDYTNGANSNIVVHIPASTGTYAGASGSAEVVVTYSQPRYFSAIMGSGAISITARSVGRCALEPISAAIILLNPTAGGALRQTGSGSIDTQDAGIIVDSNNSQAVIQTGSGSITTSTLAIAGTPGIRTVGSGTINGTIQAGSPVIPDPLTSLDEPSSASMTTQSSSRLKLTGSSSHTINPGLYVGGISLTGSGSLTMNPGIYYLQGGGISITGSGSLTGSGVMIYNDPSSSSDSISLTGSGRVTLSAPTSGLYQGVTIFQNRTATAPVKLTGSGAMNLTGTFYAAGALVNVTGSGSTNEYGSQYIADSLNITGSGTVNVTADSSLTARTRALRLVE